MIQNQDKHPFFGLLVALLPLAKVYIHVGCGVCFAFGKGCLLVFHIEGSVKNLSFSSLPP